MANDDLVKQIEFVITFLEQHGAESLSGRERPILDYLYSAKERLELTTAVREEEVAGYVVEFAKLVRLFQEDDHLRTQRSGYSGTMYDSGASSKPATYRKPRHKEQSPTESYPIECERAMREAIRLIITERAPDFARDELWQQAHQHMSVTPTPLPVPVPPSPPKPADLVMDKYHAIFHPLGMTSNQGGLTAMDYARRLGTSDLVNDIKVAANDFLNLDPEASDVEINQVRQRLISVVEEVRMNYMESGDSALLAQYKNFRAAQAKLLSGSYTHEDVVDFVAHFSDYADIQARVTKIEAGFGAQGVIDTLLALTCNQIRVTNPAWDAERGDRDTVVGRNRRHDPRPEA